MRWHIDQAEGMPAVDFIDGTVVLTFSVMPTLEALDAIIEATERSVRDLALKVEVRLPMHEQNEKFQLMSMR